MTRLNINNSGGYQKAFCLILALMLVVTSVPAMLFATADKAFAAENSSGLYYSEGKMYQADDHSKEVTGLTGWSGDKTTLTLDDFDYSTSNAVALEVAAGTTIILKGHNFIRSTNADKTVVNTYGIQGKGNLEIKGDGSLTVSGGASGTLSTGLYCEGSLTIDNGALLIRGDSNTKYSKGIIALHLTVNDGILRAIGNPEGKNGTYGYGIVLSGLYTQKAGTVIAKGNTEALSPSFEGINIGNLKARYNKNGVYNGPVQFYYVGDTLLPGKMDDAIDPDFLSVVTDLKIGPDREAALAAPAVKAQSVGVDRIKLSWNKTDETIGGYIVYRATSKNGKYKRVKYTQDTSWTDTKLQKNKKYYYKVKALRSIFVNERTEYSDMSAIVSATAKLRAPSFTLAAGKKKATVKWSTVQGASRYKIYRKSSMKGRYTTVCDTKKNSYTNKRLKSKKTYYYKMRAYKVVKGKRIYGSYSAVKKVKTK